MRFMDTHCTAWHGDRECRACDGKENAFFAGLAHPEVAALHVRIDNVCYAHGETIYALDAPASTLLVIRTGAVKLVRYTGHDATQRIVGVLKPGNVVGVDAMLAGTAQHHAVAVGEVRGCRIPLEVVTQLCMEHPGFQWNLMRQLQSSLRETEQWLLDLTCGSVPVRERMARLMLRLRDGDSERIYHFSLKDFKAMLCVTIETASRVMTEFSNLGLLVRTGKHNEQFFTADIAALERISAGESAPSP